MYEAAMDIDGANKVLDTALEKLGNEANNSALSTVQLAAAAFKSANSWQKEAAALYEKLVQDGRNLEHPVIGVAGLVRATCSFDLDLAERHAQRLPPLAGAQDLEVEELEIGDGIQTPSSRRDGGAGARGEAGLKRAAKEAGVDDEQGKEKKKRKRKPRLPKDFDPENPPPLPDPERWLPKHERQSFKKLSRNRKKQELNLKGGQGVSASEAKDAEAKLEAKKLEQPLEPETPPEVARPQTANKKKGKKGRR
ncbi:Signal recognition particle core component [Cymbomonas tetramitiformis]|uniref:Signal recognition particle core component n=1 Tax=Cymbomonas tetramitiformis TaxID=36881 RepID=A0AAE0GUZ7_9CHLO|nr:Signal recognition particle core component [Cymbomonas tetramitiformis]